MMLVMVVGTVVARGVARAQGIGTIHHITVTGTMGRTHHITATGTMGTHHITATGTIEMTRPITVMDLTEAPGYGEFIDRKAHTSEPIHAGEVSK